MRVLSEPLGKWSIPVLEVPNDFAQASSLQQRSAPTATDCGVPSQSMAFGRWVSLLKYTPITQMSIVGPLLDKIEIEYRPSSDFRPAEDGILQTQTTYTVNWPPVPPSEPNSAPLVPKLRSSHPGLQRLVLNIWLTWFCGAKSFVLSKTMMVRDSGCSIKSGIL